MKKLPLAKVIIGSFLLPWHKKELVLKTLAIPTFVLVLVWAIWALVSPQQLLINFLFYLIYFFAFSYFAITCHRLMLVKSNAKSDIYVFDIKLLVRFFLFMVSVYILSYLIEFVIITFYLNIFDSTVTGELNDEMIIKLKKETIENLKIARQIAYLPAMYVFSRLCLVFPATAIKMKKSLKWSWKLTSKNGLRILFVVAIFPWAMSIILSFVSREGSTVIEKALIALIMYLGAAIAIFALSLTYNELVENEH